jgi:serine/threonine protein kinase
MGSAMSAILLDAISVGRVIDGRFPLLQELGRTEWSSAWLTELDHGWAQRAAIKILPFESIDSLATIGRWDLARTLSHPHLMPLFDAGHCEVDGEDLLYVVTEYADETLSQILPQRPLSLEETREMLRPVLGALSYIHKLGLTHGHLTPTNIMVVDDQLKLSPDFGWCSLTRSIYDPPEAGAGNALPESDIWSLGVLLVEALTQRPPHWQRWQGGEPEIPAAIPEPLFTICRECLRIDPQRRCTLAEIKTRLKSPPAAEPASHAAGPILAQPIPEPDIDSIVVRTAKPSYEFHAIFFAGALLFLLFLIGAFKFGWDLTPSSPAPATQPPVSQPAPAPPAATALIPTATPTSLPAPALASAAAPAPGNVIKGSVAHRVLPDVPAMITGAIEGHVRVGICVEVDGKGKVYQAYFISAGPSRYFANQAMRAAQNWKFTPAQVNGRAAASTWFLRFQFGQDQTVVIPTEESP